MQESAAPKQPAEEPRKSRRGTEKKRKTSLFRKIMGVMGKR
jgi:hypothetical protein